MKRFLYEIFIFVSASMILTACEHFSETGAKIELLSGDTFEFSGEGGSQEIEVSLPCDWNASCEEDWVTITPSSGKVGKVKLTIKIDVNESIEQRAASISIGNSEFELFKEITISQKSTTRKLLYTSANNEIINPYSTDVFGANIISNTYNNGKGVISFDGPITSIGWYAFGYCTSLTSITIPDSVTSIENYAFSGCTSLTAFYGKFASTDNRCLIIDGVLNSFAPADLTEYTIPDSVTEIGAYAFCYCTSLTNVTIPDSATSIGWSAFYKCTSLTSITIPDSITKIGGVAFEDCTSLTSVTIPDSITEIGNSTFRDCTSLTSITIPDSVTEIGYEAFYNCTSLTSVTIGNGVTSIGNKAFSGCTSLKAFYGKFGSTDNRCLIIDGVLKYFAPADLTEYTIPDSVTKIGDYAFEYCELLTSITIPNSVTSIGYQAFEGCTGELIIDSNALGLYGGQFTKVVIGDSVTSIGSGAFEDCTSLTSVTIPNSVTRIGSDAFSGCTSLTSVTIPNRVTSIGIDAFEDCTSLTSVTIPNRVTSIGGYAFGSCYSLKEVYCKRTTPPIGATSMFSSNASGRKIYVPTASVDAYKAADGWSYYASDIVGYDF